MCLFTGEKRLRYLVSCDACGRASSADGQALSAPPPHCSDQVPGGAPALLSGPITLCGRSDLDAGRFFTGSLSNLMLFDTSLQPEQVRGGMGGRGGAGWRGEGPT